MLLISAGGDGVLRVWSVAVSGHLMCTLRGATGHLETVKDLCVDEDFQHLVVADSSGHIRMLDISQLDAASPEALAQSFKQVLALQALALCCPVNSEHTCIPSGVMNPSAAAASSAEGAGTTFPCERGSCERGDLC